ncbi:MAG: transporter substrate-binding domain-containing protein [Erysipelotrichaceae bacterium]
MKKTFVLMLIVCLLTICGCSSQQTNESGLIKDGVFTIAMECSYSPYNWAQADDSNGAVKIKDTNEYVNGYDIMIAKLICEANGWELEVVRSDWDSLVPAVQSGKIDAAIAGQSMTSERSLAVDFAGPYYYASFAILVKSDSDLVNATSINDFAGKKGTAQMSTIWYTACLPQMEGVEILTASESASAMLMALETNKCDFVVTDLPTATSALNVYSDFVLLDFTGTDGDFQFSQQEREEYVNIGVSVRKGNTVLLDAINNVLSKMTVDDFNELMERAISIAPTGE